MSQPIQRPDISIRLQELFRLVGRVRPSIEEYVIPTVQVADLGIAAAPPVRRVAAHGGLVQNVALEYAGFALTNPAGSNNVIQLREMRLTPTTTCGHYMAFTATTVFNTLAAVGTEQYTDTRSDDPLGQAFVGNVSAAGIVTVAAGSFHRFRVNANSTEGGPFNLQHVVLAPGQTVVICQDTVNLSLYWNLIWEEYSLL